MTIRCAVYTRKSTEEGLEQEFNSLDAQREACEAFIKSQKGLGWKALKKRYDDGGISGGTMDRPALRNLLVDIEAGKVDLVVVYKVDRLTRSLMDFARIIETFDEMKVSFVSVTQQFNTANSMGRLTLNVLLSFAQFEREVTAERIRDKIAASKKKGMWMGGLPPLGYDAVDKKLVVNEDEAQVVRALFDLYLDLGSIRDMKAEADRRGYVTKRRTAGARYTGGKPLTRGHLAQLMRNPVYVGEVAHRGETFKGQHKAIIDRAVWIAVQQLLDGQAPKRQAATNTKHFSLLAGIAFDETGDRLTPTFAKKVNRIYRYYISQRLVSEPDSKGWRLPASELETCVLHAVAGFLEDENGWASAVDFEGLSLEDHVRIRGHIDEFTKCLASFDPPIVKKSLAQIVERVIVQPCKLSITIKRRSLIPENRVTEGEAHYELLVPFHTKRRGIESKIVIGGSRQPRTFLDQNLMETVQRSFEWWHLLTEEDDWSIEKLAEHSSMNASNVTRFLPLAFLAPDIVEAIFAGRQPLNMNVERLKKIGPIPPDWAQQKRIFGFESPTG